MNGFRAVRSGGVHSFQLGAWVEDVKRQWVTGGIERGVFVPSGGEIVSIGRIGPSAAYRVKFGDAYGVIYASNASCRECGALSDDTHDSSCLNAPGAFLRVVEHDPGFAATTEALRAYNEAMRNEGCR